MEVETKKLKLDVEGMSCANCAAGIKKHLENKGLEDVYVNFSTGEASWENSNKLDKEKVKNIITELKLLVHFFLFLIVEIIEEFYKKYTLKPNF